VTAVPVAVHRRAVSTAVAAAVVVVVMVAVDNAAAVVDATTAARKVISPAIARTDRARALVSRVKVAADAITAAKKATLLGIVRHPVRRPAVVRLAVAIVAATSVASLAISRATALRRLPTEREPFSDRPIDETCMKSKGEARLDEEEVQEAARYDVNINLGRV